MPRDLARLKREILALEATHGQRYISKRRHFNAMLRTLRAGGPVDPRQQETLKFNENRDRYVRLNHIYFDKQGDKEEAHRQEMGKPEHRQFGQIVPSPISSIMSVSGPVVLADQHKPPLKTEWPYDPERGIQLDGYRCMFEPTIQYKLYLLAIYRELWDICSAKGIRNPSLINLDLALYHDVREDTPNTPRLAYYENDDFYTYDELLEEAQQECADVIQEIERRKVPKEDCLRAIKAYGILTTEIPIQTSRSMALPHDVQPMWFFSQFLPKDHPNYHDGKLTGDAELAAATQEIITFQPQNVNTLPQNVACAKHKVGNVLIFTNLANAIYELEPHVVINTNVIKNKEEFKDPNFVGGQVRVQQLQLIRDAIERFLARKRLHPR